MIYRSLLFVPGSKPDRFDRAVASGADGIIIDLEDAVAPQGKAEAREASLSWLAQRGAAAGAGLRINSPRTADGCADIAALAAARPSLDFVMIPKAETGVDVEIVREALGELAPLIAVMESGRALVEVQAIASQSDGLLFGGGDFSASVGGDLADWDAMLTARSLVAAAAGASGIPAYDVPYLDVREVDGLTATTERVKKLGFTGRSCIHPAQIEAVNNVFAPNTDEIENARGIVSALEASDGGAVLYKGKLVDRPIILAAQRILARAQG